MDYKIGDKVRVRSDLVVGDDYKSTTWGEVEFTEKMDKFSWQIVSISEIDTSDNTFKIEQCFDWFADTMVEPVVITPLSKRPKYEWYAIDQDGTKFESNAIWWRSLEEIKKEIEERKESIKRDESLLRRHKTLFSKKK